MKKQDDLVNIGKLLKDIGFNESRPETTRQALFKHILKAAEELRSKPLHIEGEQLTFDPAVLGRKSR